MNSYHRDGSSARVTYTVIDCDANARPHQELPVEVSHGGLLTTSAFSGQACLLVSSVEDFGVNQSALVHVKVNVTLIINVQCVIFAWNMRWRAPDQEVDQRGHGRRLCKKIAKHII